jgi:hypothetical protein
MTPRYYTPEGIARVWVEHEDDAATHTIWAPELKINPRFGDLIDAFGQQSAVTAHCPGIFVMIKYVTYFIITKMPGQCARSGTGRRKTSISTTSRKLATHRIWPRCRTSRSRTMVATTQTTPVTNSRAMTTRLTSRRTTARPISSQSASTSSRTTSSRSTTRSATATVSGRYCCATWDVLSGRQVKGADQTSPGACAPAPY